MRLSRETTLGRVLTGALSMAMAAFMTVGCGTTNTRALQTARVLYSQAQNNPDIALNASASLNEAALVLQKAEREEDPAEQRHLAQLAETRTRQAMAEAQAKQAEKQAAELREQRNRMLIQDRERESAAARSQARISRQQAEQAQARAETATREMQIAQTQAQQARQENIELQKQLEGLQAKETERGLILTLSDIYFRVNRAELEPGAALNLSRLADFLRKHPDRRVLIEGHTDSSGTPAYNASLSQQRANSVRDLLIANGVNPNQVTAKGYGESFPVATNMTVAGRQQNRRADIVLSGSG